MIHILTWDYREQPNIDELDRMVYDISATGQPVRIHNIEDTGSDQYAIVITNREDMTSEEARSAYVEWEDSRG